MASVNFSGGKLHGASEAKAQFRHSEKEERMKHDHANEHIDKTKTMENYSMENLSYGQLCNRYDKRIAEVDAVNTNKRKDRVTCQCLDIPVPEHLPREQYKSWFKRVHEILKDFYGERNMIDTIVHVDEEHMYKDEKGNDVMSRVHGHSYLIPEVDGKLNGKAFSSRKNMFAVNRLIHEMTMDEFGVQFMDGSKAKSKKTVEQLKTESAIREAEAKANEIILDSVTTCAEMEALAQVDAMLNAQEESLEIVAVRHEMKRQEDANAWLYGSLKKDRRTLEADKTAFADDMRRRKDEIEAQGRVYLTKAKEAFDDSLTLLQYIVDVSDKADLKAKAEKVRHEIEKAEAVKPIPRKTLQHYGSNIQKFLDGDNDETHYTHTGMDF